MDVAKFKKRPVMGILRGAAMEHIEPLVEAAVKSGLETLEITMNTPGAAGLIKQAAKVSKNRLMLGAGTVLDTESMKLALDSGASFIVMPCVIDEVMGHCVKNAIPVFPGALTPSEIYQAWEKGATMVKVFPAKFFGPEYFREIKGPFEKIELLACAGVTPQNMKDYFACGADAVSFGASVFKRQWLMQKDFAAIGDSIKVFVAELEKVKGGVSCKTS